MAGNETRAVRPHTPQDRLKVAAGSALALQGIFLEILRERFQENAGLEWYWNSDPTLTKILIETNLNEELETRNQVPALYVSRLQTTPSKIAVGDRAEVNLPDHKEYFKALMRVDMQVDCVSNDEGESTVLGDIVQFMLLASQDVIQNAFGLHDFTHPVLGQTVPSTADQTKWVSSVNFSIEFWIHWTQVPIAPLLTQLAQRITIDGADTFTKTVLNSMRRAT